MTKMYSSRSKSNRDRLVPVHLTAVKGLGLVTLHLLCCLLLREGIHLAVWFYLAPLLLMLRIMRMRAVLPLIVLSSFLNGLILIHWVSAYTADAFRLVFTLWLLFWMGFLVSSKMLMDRLKNTAFIPPVLWLAATLLLGLSPVGSSWREPAMFWPTMAPVIWWTGASGASFLIVLFNSLLSMANKPRNLIALAAVAAVPLAGAFWPTPSQDATIKVCAVQGNFPQDWDWRVRNATGQVFSTYMTTSKACAGSANAIIWPEYAIVGELTADSPKMLQIRDFTDTTRKTLIFGSLRWLPGKTDGMRNRKDIATVVSPGNPSLQTYASIRPVPFEKSVTPGDRPGLVNVNGHTIGLLMCFEEILPDISSTLTRSGAEALVVLANNSMFRGTAGIQFASLQSRLRAAENRRWLLRCTNTGQTQIVDPCGRVISSCPPDRLSFLAGDLHMTPELSPFSRWGKLGTLILAILLIAIGQVSNMTVKFIRNHT